MCHFWTGTFEALSLHEKFNHIQLSLSFWHAAKTTKFQTGEKVFLFVVVIVFVVIIIVIMIMIVIISVCVFDICPRSSRVSSQ